eukprot:3293082-Amphidinium_carterae.1
MLHPLICVSLRRKQFRLTFTIGSGSSGRGTTCLGCEKSLYLWRLSFAFSFKLGKVTTVMLDVQRLVKRNYK